MKDLISIIIPIYNCEKYLNELFDSIDQQIYQNYEVLLINDGSIDDSETICKKYTKKNKKVRYFYKDNSGVSNTRNLGISMAKGKYICFVDADDIISPNYLSDLINIMTDEECGMACCLLERFTSIVQENKLLNSYTCYENDNKYNLLFSNYGGYIANKLFISKILKEKNILFKSDIFMSEDLLFVYEYLNYISKVKCIENENYNYRYIKSSASKYLANVRWFSIYKVWDVLRDGITNNNLKKDINYRYQMYLYEGIYRTHFIKDKDKQKLIKNDINDRIKKFNLNSKEYSMYKKIKLILYKYFNYIAYSLKFFIKG